MEIGKLTAQGGRLPRSWAAAKLAKAREKRAAVTFMFAVFVVVMMVFWWLDWTLL